MISHRQLAWILKLPVVIRAGSPVIVRIAKRDRRYVAFDFDVKRGDVRDRVAEDGQRRRLGIGRRCHG